MPKTSLQTTVYICSAGAFGLFFRWLQLQLAFDENGLVGGSMWNIVVPLSILVAAWLFSRFVRSHRDEGRSLSGNFYAALKNEGKLFPFLRWAIGGLMCLGALLLLVKSETDKYVGILRIMALLGVLAGLSFPLLLSAANKSKEETKPGLLCLYSFMPILFFAWWLVFCYRANAINSVVWSFLIEILTVCVMMIAFFRLAGFAFEQPKPERAMTLAMLGAYLGFMSLADGRYLGMQVMLFAATLMLVLYTWIMVANLQQGEAPRREKPNDGFESLK